MLNKIDLLPYVPFDIDAAERNARQVHGDMEIVRVSCTTREGLREWLDWLGRKRAAPQAAAVPASTNP